MLQKSFSVLSDWLRVGRGKTEQFEIVSLEHEGQGLGERCIGNTFQQRMVNVIEGERLLDVVSHFVDGDVIGFVVHAALFHAGPQVCLFRTHFSSHGVTGAARGINHNILGNVLRPLGREPEFHQQVGNVQLIGLGGRILLRNHLIQLRLSVLAAWAKAAIPDIKRLERTLQPRFDKLRDLRDERRGQHLFQHGLNSGFRNLTIFVEAASDQCGCGRRIRIGLFRREECFLQRRITRVWFTRVARLRRWRGRAI